MGNVYMYSLSAEQHCYTKLPNDAYPWFRMLAFLLIKSVTGCKVRGRKTNANTEVAEEFSIKYRVYHLIRNLTRIM
jgi:hypothetical protein